MKELSKRTAIRHGEVILIPVSKIPNGRTEKHTSYIVGHSESGHHHVLESKTAFEVTEDEKKELYIRLFAPAEIVHKKTYDIHPTLPVEAPMYRIGKKTEYDPLERVTREVYD